ncbi:Listeria/Bacterioides repeat-containing protein [Paramicrobacterium humi]|uniref:Listeria/Bacterioides repeat-containing protein n=1 Tax=Paramicrobacterium humi TaxID=640635 RepID=A0A1H4PPS7_9MICO|nr:InlB B-repeat-containing protein [Microbacterium humi]SEC09406.1 Listeria/Bacterioides repeat-containing protein [Microbacterium humi]
MIRRTALRRTLHGVAVAAIASIGLPAIPAHEINVATASELVVAVAGLSDGEAATVVLDVPLTLEEELDVPSGVALTIDLSGHDLTIAASHEGDAGIGVPVSSAFTLTDRIDDSRARAAITGAVGGAGIGGDAGEKTGEIRITAARVEAHGGDCGAGIGAGRGGAAGTVHVIAGDVTATGSAGAAGIGGGCGSDGGVLEIGSEATVTLEGAEGPAFGGVAKDGAERAFGRLDNAGVLRIASGTLTVPSGASAEQPLMRNTGRLEIGEQARLVAEGVVENAGTITPADRVDHVENVHGHRHLLSFEDADGTVTAFTVLAASLSGAGIELPTRERPDARFDGWSGPDGTPFTTASPLTPASGDADVIRLRVRWIVAVRFNGLDAPIVELAAGSTVAQPFSPLRDGYRFAGWADAAGSPWDFRAPVHGDLELYATWAPSDDGTTSGPAPGLVAVTGTVRSSPMTTPAHPAPASDREKEPTATIGRVDASMIGLGVLVLLMVGGMAFGFGSGARE